MKKKGILLLFASAITLAAAPLLISCSDDDNDSPGGTPVEQNHIYNYLTHMVGSDDGEHLLLDSITAGITNIESNVSWLTATSAEPVNGHPVLQISSQRSDSETSEEAAITVTAENGDRAIVTVKHLPLGMGDAYSGGNANFIKEWWKCSTVQLNGITMPQGTPWIIENSPHIPEDVRVQYTPTKGWEMAFCYLNDASIQGVRFFALYNKWSGQLRIYTYVEDPTGWGSSLDFKVYFGTANSNDMFPCYHIFQYGIPSNHILGTSLERYAKLVSMQNQTFCTWLSPYMASNSLSPGWYVMETDLSAYVPEGKPWIKEGKDSPMIKIFAETSTLENVTLNGTLTGSVSGTFSNPEVVQSGGNSALSGICNVLGTISDMCSGSISSCNTYGALMNRNGGNEGIGAYLNPTKYWGGFACSVAGGGLSMMSDFLYPVSYDTIPGKIDLTLDATLALEGYITSNTSNSHTPIAISASGIQSAQGDDGHMGKGIWGLADDPVVYIDKDDLMASMSRLKVTAKDGGYTCLDASKANLRMVYAFDPTSIKVNLNRDLYPEVYDMAVTTTVGIYTDRKTGNTDAFRKMLTLDARPSFSLSEKTSGVFTMNAASKPAIWPITPTDLLETDSRAYETPSNCSLVAQDGGANLQFYGRSVQASAQNIMVDPQVYVPYNGSTYSNPIAPDFLVTVTVTFYTDPNHDDNAVPNIFSKTFIPKIKLVSRSDMKTVSTRLQDFSNKCAAGQSINTLANDKSIPIYYPGGDKLVSKCLRMLRYIGL